VGVGVGVGVGAGRATLVPGMGTSDSPLNYMAT